MLYEYSANVVRVVDGDTVDVLVDLGFKISMKMRLRLQGIDAPEIFRGDEASREKGKLARTWLESQVLGMDVLIVTNKDKTGKFGRYVAKIYLEERDICDEMVKEGHAVVSPQ